MNSVACALAALTLGGGAAGHHLDTVVQDDAQLLYRGPVAADRAVRSLAGLGADAVRLTASWSVLAPAPTAPSAPGRPFRPRDSRTYPTAGFAHLDHAVRAATAAGLRVQIDLGFWAPRWAVARPGPDPTRERDAPDPHAFAAFAESVARRYTGRFPDPGHRGRRLPAVRLWTTWNEPNNPDFLMPQWQHEGRGWRPASPHVYRRMHEAAYDAIKRVDGRDLVLVGGTAPMGGTGDRTGASARCASCASWRAWTPPCAHSACPSAPTTGRCVPTATPITPTGCSATRRRAIRQPTTCASPTSRACVVCSTRLPPGDELRARCRST